MYCTSAALVAVAPAHLASMSNQAVASTAEGSANVSGVSRLLEWPLLTKWGIGPSMTSAKCLHQAPIFLCHMALLLYAGWLLDSLTCS